MVVDEAEKEGKDLFMSQTRRCHTQYPAWIYLMGNWRAFEFHKEQADMMMVKDGTDFLEQLLSLAIDDMDKIIAFHLSPIKNVMALNFIKQQKWKYVKTKYYELKFIFQLSVFPR